MSGAIQSERRRAAEAAFDEWADANLYKACSTQGLVYDAFVAGWNRGEDKKETLETRLGNLSARALDISKALADLSEGWRT